MTIQEQLEDFTATLLKESDEVVTFLQDAGSNDIYWKLSTKKAEAIAVIKQQPFYL